MFFKIVSSSKKEIESDFQSTFLLHFVYELLYQRCSSLGDGTEPPPLICKSVMFIKYEWEFAIKEFIRCNCGGRTSCLLSVLVPLTGSSAMCGVLLPVIN